MMTYFHGRTLVVILSFMSVSFLAVYTKEISTQGSSGVIDSVKPVLPFNLSSPDVDLTALMPMDAADGTMPRICTPNSTCALQAFRRVNGQFYYREALEYCVCPEPQLCVETGVNNKSCFLIFGCRNTEVVSTTEAGIRNASDFSQLVVSTTSMVPQNSATEPGEPVPFKFEGDFPPSMNC